MFVGEERCYQANIDSNNMATKQGEKIPFFISLQLISHWKLKFTRNPIDCEGIANSLITLGVVVATC